MERIKVGLAAYGMSGQVFHAPFIHTNPHFELSKIVERSKELSKERYPYAMIVRSFEELIQDPAIELVVVNTPDATHYEYARMALEAGKHVIVEKPFTSTTAQGEELIALAAAKGLMLSVYQNRRWDADFLTVREIISNGLLGRLVEYDTTFCLNRNCINPGTWKETGNSGGGLTYNLGSHLIDQAVLLFGMPEAVFADIDILRTDGKVDDYFMIRFIRPSLAPDVKVTLKASYLMREAEPRFVLHGTLGSFVKCGTDKQEAALLRGEMPDQPCWGEETEAELGWIHTEIDRQEISRRYPGIPGNYGGFYQNIYEHLRLGKPLQTGAHDILNVIRVIEAAYRSQQERKIIELK